MSADSRLKRMQVLVLGTVLLALASTVHSADMELVLSPELQARILAQVPQGKAARTIERFSATHEIDHKANFSKTYADEKSIITMLEDGLTGMTGSTAFRSSSSKGAGRGMSLCGLVPLLVESGSNVDTSVASVVPAGKAFLPFSIKSDIDVSNRVKLSAFEANIPSICSPAPGSEFSYKTETAVQFKTSGPFGRTNDFQRIESTSCKVAAASSPASQLNASLTGDYWAVSCQVTPQTGAARQADYAYLPDARFYLPLYLKDEWQSTKISYSEFVYATP